MLMLHWTEQMILKMLGFFVPHTRITYLRTFNSAGRSYLDLGLLPNFSDLAWPEQITEQFLDRLHERRMVLSSG